jgi:pimeloyl-ACP methyl ester carboxylesterase
MNPAVRIFLYIQPIFIFSNKIIIMSIQKIPFKSTTVRFATHGKGKAVVLLHGYLESLEIWNSFASELAKKFQVISIDLLGHGRSGTLNGEASVELMAESVKAVLDYLNIKKSVIIGHSMGGYSMLAFAEMYPDRILGIGLFHSITWADLPEKREARDREIELVKQGKKELVINTNIPKGFADDNLEKLGEHVNQAKKIGFATSETGIIAALNAMKARKNRTYILDKIDVPVLFVAGKKDNYIPVERLLQLTNMPKKKYVAILENSGHMGFIEEKELALDEVENFLDICFL